MLIILLPTLLLAGSDFQAGVNIDKIFNLDVVQEIMQIGAYFIYLFFFIQLGKQMYNLITGKSPDFVGVVIKFGFIIFLYTNAVPVVTWFTNKVIVQSVAKKSDTETLSKTFADLDSALVDLAMGDPQQLEMKKKESRVTALPDSVTDTFVTVESFLSVQTVVVVGLSVFMKGCIILSMASKMLMIDMFWPLFFQLVIIGFIFAVPFASIDNGIDSIKKAAINIIEVAMIPVIFNLAFSLIVGRMTDTIRSYIDIIHSPIKEANAPMLQHVAASARATANLPLIAEIIGFLVFLIFLAFLSPLITRMIVRNESVGMGMSALTYTVGRQLTRLAGSLAGAAGGAVAGGVGKGLMAMTKKGANELSSGGGGGGDTGGGGDSGGGGTDSAPAPEGDSAGSGSSSKSPIRDLNTGTNQSASGREAHGGKPFYNQKGLSKSENMAKTRLRNNPDAQKDFNKLSGMKRDGMHEKAINNQIGNINKKYGTDLPKYKQEKE